MLIVLIRLVQPYHSDPGFFLGVSPFYIKGHYARPRKGLVVEGPP